jgi:glutaredoxin
MSGADPDLLNQLHLSQPEHDSHSISELNKTKQSIQSATEKAPQVKQNDIHQQMSQTHEAPHRINPNQTSGNATVPGKTRPSSAITNYTSG